MDMRDISSMSREELVDEAMQRPGNMFTLFIDEGLDGRVAMADNFDSEKQVVEVLEETIRQIMENIPEERVTVPPEIEMLTKNELASIFIERSEQCQQPALVIYEEDKTKRKLLIHSFKNVGSVSMLLRELASYFENSKLEY